LSAFVGGPQLGYIVGMATKLSSPPDDDIQPRGRFWQPPGQRDRLSEEGRKWAEENAEAIKSMNEWVKKNGLPLAKYRQF
jgi:hypothetical protein